MSLLDDLAWISRMSQHVPVVARRVPLIVEGVKKLLAEREKIQADERILTCVYCGHEYPPGTPSANHELLRKHIEVCPEHPLATYRRKSEAEIAGLNERIRTMSVDSNAAITRLLEEVERLKRGEMSKEEFHNLCHEGKKPVTLEEFCTGCEQYQQKLYGQSPITEMKAKMSERKTVHQWLNEIGIPQEEAGKKICLLRRLRILTDRYRIIRTRFVGVIDQMSGFLSPGVAAKLKEWLL